MAPLCWVKPKIVVEVCSWIGRAMGCCEFIGVRDDKPARQIYRDFAG
jgi:hypothetical protein